jgi:hypothetical protein
MDRLIRAAAGSNPAVETIYVEITDVSTIESRLQNGSRIPIGQRSSPFDFKNS